MIGGFIFLSCDGERELGERYDRSRCAGIWPPEPGGIEVAAGLVGFALDELAERGHREGWLVGLRRGGRRADLCPHCARLVTDRRFGGLQAAVRRA